MLLLHLIFLQNLLLFISSISVVRCQGHNIISTPKPTSVNETDAERTPTFRFMTKCVDFAANLNQSA